MAVWDGTIKSLNIVKAPGTSQIKLIPGLQGVFTFSNPNKNGKDAKGIFWVCSTGNIEGWKIRLPGSGFTTKDLNSTIATLSGPAVPPGYSTTNAAELIYAADELCQNTVGKNIKAGKSRGSCSNGVVTGLLDCFFLQNEFGLDCPNLVKNPDDIYNGNDDFYKKAESCTLDCNLYLQLNKSVSNRCTFVNSLTSYTTLDGWTINPTVTAPFEKTFIPVSVPPLDGNGYFDPVSKITTCPFPENYAPPLCTTCSQNYSLDTDGLCTVYKCTQPSDCLNGGTCSGTGTCNCPVAWTGDNCSIKKNCIIDSDCTATDPAAVCHSGVCFKCLKDTDCGANGTCSAGKCACNAEYYGNVCQYNCTGAITCNNSGACTPSPNDAPPTCTCIPNCSGANCEKCCPIDSKGNVCSNNGTCKDSASCTCNIGFSGNACQYACPKDSAGNICAGHGTCSKQCTDTQCKCDCDAGYGPPESCAQQCPAGCSSPGGTCDFTKTPATCICSAGYRGTNCTIKCPTDSSGNICSNHGTCDTNGQCQCNSGFSGSDCSQTGTCPNKCNTPNGKCVDNKCVCADGYFGDDCSRSCPKIQGQVCSGHGTCQAGVCLCDQYWLAPDCSKCSDSKACGPRKSCNEGTCGCAVGFSGDDCYFDGTLKSFNIINNTSCTGKCVSVAIKSQGNFTVKPSSPTGTQASGIFTTSASAEDSNIGIISNYSFTNNGKGFTLDEINLGKLEVVLSGPATNQPNWTKSEYTKMNSLVASLCPSLSSLPCSGNGSCAKGICTCSSGYTGNDCSIAPSPQAPASSNWYWYLAGIFVFGLICFFIFYEKINAS